MDRQRVRDFIRKGFKLYLIYAFVFAVLIFAIQKPKENLDFFTEDYAKSDKINKDRVSLVESGEDGALVRLNLIENAEQSIDISYYILLDGISTELLLGSLVDAADRGVEVRILVDGIFHNFRGNLKDTIYGFNLHPNMELKYYQPLNLLSPLSWNNRLHDKIIIVDKKLALIGGRNIGDKYFIEEMVKNDFVKDRDVLIFKDESLDESSSVISDMQRYFNEVWNHEYSKPSIKKIKSKQRDKGEAFNEKLKAAYIEFKKDYQEELRYVDWFEKTSPTDNIRFVYNPIGKANGDPWCLRELLEISSKAENSIFIQSPYIIPSRNMKNKFSNYHIDYGIVTMLTNSLSSSPNPFAIAGYTNSRKEIVDSGVDIYEYQGPKSIHSKTYIIDDYISVVGSFNFDARSSYLNTESMVIIESDRFTKHLKKNIQRDLDNSLMVGQDYQYISNENIEEGKVSTMKNILIKSLSKIVWFVDYLL